MNPYNPYDPNGPPLPGYGPAPSPSPTSAPEGPLPCGRCGAAMHLAGPPDPYSNTVHLACRYCGAAETLTHEARVRLSHERLGLLRMAREAAEAPARAVDALIARRPWLGGLFVGAVILLNGLSQLAQTWSSVRTNAALPEELRTELLVRAAATPGFGLGVALGVYGGWFLALKQYRRVLDPGRWALPPMGPAGTARCRCCGGDLPPRWGALVECAFCRTPNLLAPEVLARREALLLEETQRYQQRAAGVLARAAQFTPQFGRYSLAGAVLGAVLLGGGAGLAAWLLA